MNTTGRQLEETRSATSTGDVDREIYEMQQRLENITMKKETAEECELSTPRWAT